MEGLAIELPFSEAGNRLSPPEDKSRSLRVHVTRRETFEERRYHVGIGTDREEELVSEMRMMIGPGTKSYEERQKYARY